MSADDLASLRAYWSFYEQHASAIHDRVRRVADALPERDRVSRALALAEPPEQDRRNRLLRDAILENRWDAYLEDLRRRGERFATAGVPHRVWLELLATLREAVGRELAEYERDGARRPAADLVRKGKTQLFDLMTETLTEAYVAVKERLSTGLYRAMFEHSPLPMWTVDRETLAFVQVNEAAIRHYGYTREEFAAMTLADIRPPEDVPALLATVGSASSRIPGEPSRHLKKDGSLIRVELDVNDFVIDGRDVRLVVVHDVTERLRTEEALREAEAQLRHAQKMEAIGALAGGVAHDFANVLTVIESYAVMLEENTEADDARHHDAAEIRRAAERAAGITRQLLMVSGRRTVAPSSLQLDEVVIAFVPMLRRLLGQRIALSVHGGDVPAVLADRGHLEQVLMNLAVNARDAMPRGGRLTIETSAVELDDEAALARGLPAGRYVALAVTDTGAGMDVETQHRIFDPFFTTKELGKGTGLGLAIVHGIVQQAGGSITVYSAPGHGACFRILLPIGPEGLPVASGEAVPAPRTLPPITVLVVDDDLEVRTVAARILQEAGCTVLTASSAHEARRICVSHEDPIDVVVLDVVLDDGSGARLLRQLTDLRPAIHCVLMSGYPIGALNTVVEASSDLLAKPFSPSQLRAAVARALPDRADHEARPEGAAPRRTAGPVRTRVLVADDDPTLRRSIARLLRKAELDVVEVDSGRRAIAELQAARFDVILSDVHMPDGGGLELVRAVRGVDLDVPLILMSGAPDVQTAAAAVEYGAFRYLIKPLDTEALPRIIRRAARAHSLARLRREAFSATGAHAGAVDRAGLEVRFEHALEHLSMAFQPIYDARTSAVYGVEALMRSSELSMPNPSHVLDAATHLGRLPELGRRVRGLSAAAFAPRGGPLSLFVNLHPEDLADAHLIDDSAPLTQMASRVVLEITERASLHSSPELTARIRRLRQLGFRIAVDDIGAGFSGLTSFTELEPEIVKIDMSLVRDVHQSALKQRTIEALVRLCHEVGAVVVGEGVESQPERDCLVSLGCDLLQGYLLGKPSGELPPA